MNDTILTSKTISPQKNIKQQTRGKHATNYHNCDRSRSSKIAVKKLTVTASLLESGFHLAS